MPSVKAHTMPDLANYKLRFRPKSASQIKNKKRTEQKADKNSFLTVLHFIFFCAKIHYDMPKSGIEIFMERDVLYEQDKCSSYA